MHLEGCHMCRKSPEPTEAMTVDFNSVDLRSIFQGRFILVVHTSVSDSTINGFSGPGAVGNHEIKQYDDNPTQIVFLVKEANQTVLVGT